MKVLVCIPCLLTGGTEIQTLALVQALLRAGHQVRVVCYFEHSAVMVDRYRRTGAEVILLSPEGIRPVGLKTTLSQLWSALRRQVREFRPEVTHVQYMAPGGVPIILLRLFGAKRIVATAHTPADIYSPGGLKLVQWLARHVLTAFQCITLRAEKSFFGSASLYDEYTTLTRRGNHFTIYNALPDYISIREEGRPRMDGNLITIGVVSRLEHIKGMDLVVPAFAKVCAMSNRVRLLVVGDGSQRELMEESARELGVIDKVEFVGRKGQDELEGYYDRMDILLMPSRSEGFGLTAIEGMARGVVPVVSNTGGLPEVVTPDTGLLHERESVEDLATKIVELVSEEELLCRLSTGSIERAKQFAAVNYDRLIASLYSKL
ncbi:MAG: glycosyltransferase family 4 protein [Lepagella sp.]